MTGRKGYPPSRLYECSRGIQASLGQHCSIGGPLILVLLPFFWLAGGIRWLETKAFPPGRPRFMPVNSVWIDAPSLPISWHYGWWFGCGVSDLGQSNYCRLMKVNGGLVYGSNYLSCRDHLPMGN